MRGRGGHRLLASMLSRTTTTTTTTRGGGGDFNATMEFWNRDWTFFDVNTISIEKRFLASTAGSALGRWAKSAEETTREHLQTTTRQYSRRTMMMQQPTTTMTLGGRDRERSLNERRRREKTTMTSRILKEGEGEEEMMLEDDDPDNPANSKPKGPIGQAFDFLSAVALACATAVAAVAGASYYVQTTEELEKKVKEKDFEKESVVPGAQQFAEYLLEFRQFIDEKSSHYLDPISDKLLPDHPPDAVYIPHTLVLDLDDTLINSNWNRERGWRVFKRPGVDPFLEHLAQFYEMVVFTDQLLTYGEPILERLDPKRYVTHRLFRESAQYKHGEYIRDLSKLNRDMERVIYISSKPRSAEMNPENVIPIQPWRFEDGSTDTALLDLMPFLESIVRLGVADVRAVLSSYKEEMNRTGKDIPQIFRERQQKFQKKRLEQAKQVAPIGRGKKKRDAW